MELILIKNEDVYKKDLQTGAVLATNNENLLAYRNQRKHYRMVMNDINNIKREMKEIKEILGFIINTLDTRDT
jgi:hypothetical protein